MKRLYLRIVAVLALTAVFASSVQATARVPHSTTTAPPTQGVGILADAYPCTYSGRYPSVPYACPVWWPGDGRIPIYEFPSQSSRVIDYLLRSTGTQYFNCEVGGGRYSAYGYTNVYWGWTYGDKYGQWGYVSEVFFRGGGNDQSDPGLPLCAPN